MLTATSSPYSEFDATESNAALAAKVLSVVRDIRTQLHPSLQDSQSKAYATSSELEVSKQRENAKGAFLGPGGGPVAPIS